MDERYNMPIKHAVDDFLEILGQELKADDNNIVLILTCLQK